MIRLVVLEPVKNEEVGVPSAWKGRLMSKPGTPYEQLVAEIVQDMDSNASVEQGVWVEGPDGSRELDVIVRGSVDGTPYSFMIECKDYDPSSTGKVDIQQVDAIDSKRHDVDVGLAIICSNSGFTAGAVRKATRKGIGLISVLRSGDDRVRFALEQEIYMSEVRLNDVTFQVVGGERPPGIQFEEVLHEGRPVMNWLENRAFAIAARNPMVDEPLVARFRLRDRTQIETPSGKCEVDELRITFTPARQWYSKVARIDASRAIYDWIRGRLRLVGSGDGSYTIHDVGFEDATPIKAPSAEALAKQAALSDASVSITMFEGVHFSSNSEIPDLSGLVIPEDLSLEVDNPSEVPPNLLPQ